MNPRILIVDEDVALSKRLEDYLIQEEFEVSLAHDGKTGLKKALNQPFEALIIDVMLPQLNGFELLNSFRENTDIPVLILTSRDDEIDHIVGLELGADDYITKPYNPYELIARLRAILRRTQKGATHRSSIHFHNIIVDCEKRTAKIDTQCLDLTNTEFNILEILIKSPGQAFSKEELTEYALGRKYTAYDRSIDVHISNLRNKLGNNPNGEAWVKTIRGFGYLFNA